MFRTIAILGGTGSLGHALTAFLLRETTATIRILSRDEAKQDTMAQTFAAHAERLRFLLGDIRDPSRLIVALRNVDLVVHAAALKRIPQGEHDPLEFVQTNIMGTSNVLYACIYNGVHTAVFVSSDKACLPVNLYGQTKAVGERLWLQGNSYAPEGTRFVALRYGNVGGSRGSVIPYWQSQLAAGLPLSLTDPGMSRFYLSLDEAVSYAWHTACRAPRGCLFVPHLPAFLLTDLMRAVAPDAYARITGIRPGEKLAEALMTDDERQRARPVIDADGRTFGYLIPPAVRSWALDETLLPPEAVKPLEHYVSDTWSWRLGVDDLRMRLKEG